MPKRSKVEFVIQANSDVDETMSPEYEINGESLDEREHSGRKHDETVKRKKKKKKNDLSSEVQLESRESNNDEDDAVGPGCELNEESLFELENKEEDPDEAVRKKKKKKKTDKSSKIILNKGDNNSDEDETVSPGHELHEERLVKLENKGENPDEAVKRKKKKKKKELSPKFILEHEENSSDEDETVSPVRELNEERLSELEKKGENHDEAVKRKKKKKENELSPKFVLEHQESNSDEDETVSPGRELNEERLSELESKGENPDEAVTRKKKEGLSSKIRLEKPTSIGLHQCTECLKQFTNLKSLSRHLKRHTVGKQFKCSHCDSAFYSLSDFKRHSETFIHKSKKVFPCSYCDKKFTYRYVLKQHENAHLGNFYTCKGCSKMYIYKRDLVRHVKHAHPELDPRDTNSQKIQDEGLTSDRLDRANRVERHKRGALSGGGGWIS